METKTLVLDASVGVKWFSARAESFLDQAIDIREAHLSNRLTIMVPDLFYYEVANAIVHKKFFQPEIVQNAISALYSLDLQNTLMDRDLMHHSIEIARQNSLTVYDACYMALAQRFSAPLVTANPKHLGQALGCEVIPVEKWQ